MKDKFKYIVILVVLLIPFIYSYFYLLAYWNPYGKGNIDNLPVAIVNEDEGDKGKKLITSIRKSKKLKLKELDEEKANEELNKGKYYAVINIPKSFTKDMDAILSVNALMERRVFLSIMLSYSVFHQNNKR